MRPSHCFTPYQLAIGLAVAVSLFGCGQERFGASGNTARYTNNIYSSGNPDGTTDPVPNATESPTPTNPLIQPLRRPVQAVGYNGTDSVMVSTRTILKVQFKPSINTRLVAGTGYSPQYSRLAVFVTVGTSSHPTALLSVGYTGDGTSGDVSEVLDYSSEIPHTCPSDQPSCRVSVRVQVGQANDDWACLNYGYCPHTRTWDDHPWAGTLIIYTDDTVQPIE